MEASLQDREHLLEVALVCTLAGLVCGVFLLVKIGVFDHNKKDFRTESRDYKQLVEKPQDKNRP